MTDAREVIQQARRSALFMSTYEQMVNTGIRVVLQELRERLQPYDIEDGDGIPMRTRRNAVTEIDEILKVLDA